MSLLPMLLLLINLFGRSYHYRSDINEAKHIVYGSFIPRSIHLRHPYRVMLKNETPPLKKYKDVFIPGHSGRPTLGTMSATCWARGGICVEIKECPSLKIDVSIAGCSWGHKVCCKVQEPLSPTVGRRAELPTINRPEDLGSVLQITAYRNSLLLSHMN